MPRVRVTEPVEKHIVITNIARGSATFRLIGVEPLILYRMSEKSLRELLFPSKKKNKNERESTLKHDPRAEFQASPYRLTPHHSWFPRDSKASGLPTLLCHVSTAFKGALMGAALDIPGAAKTEVGRLILVKGDRVPIYGVPKLHMAPVRLQNMNKTPDIRTRCIVPEWACQVEIEFNRPQFTFESVANLLNAAGMMQGVGDWRPGKGKGVYGQFRIVSDGTDGEKAWERIVKTGELAAQVKAMEEEEPYDDESSELLEWFDTESKRREIKAA